MADPTEIILICARGLQLKIVGIFEPGIARDEHLGIPITDNIGDLAYSDVILFAQLYDLQGSYDNLVNIVGDHWILTPEFLNISSGRTNRIQ